MSGGNRRRSWGVEACKPLVTTSSKRDSGGMLFDLDAGEAWRVNGALQASSTGLSFDGMMAEKL